MAIIHLPNGIGYSTGDDLAVNSPIEVNADVWYVDSQTGTDGASPLGKDDNNPLASISQAHTNAADGDIVVFLDGHTETLTAAQSITKDLTFVGAGSSGGLPTVKFTNNQSAGNLFTVTSSHCQFRNIWFEEESQSNTSNTVNMEGAGLYIIDGCYFEADGNSTVASLKTSGSTTRVYMKSTTFISTATSVSSQPYAGWTSGTGEIYFLNGVTFDGGSVGWSNIFALDIADDDVTGSYIWAQNISLLNGADMRTTESSLGYVNVQTSSGGARVDWCDV